MFKKPMFFYDASSGNGSGSEPGTSTDYKALYESLKRDVDGGKFIAMERYTGLQGVLQVAQDKVKALETDLGGVNGKLGDLTVAKTTLEQQLSALQGTLGELQTYKQTSEEKLATLEKKTGRYDVLITKFPDLVPFEQKKLLPDAPIDQLETVFGNFRSTITELTKEAGKKLVQGATPEGAGTAGAAGSGNLPTDKATEIKSLQDQKKEAALKGDVKQYDALDAKVKALQSPS